MHKLLILLLSVLLTCSALAQVPEHISNKPLYDFLDELANEQVIGLVSGMKPYPRLFIAEKLSEAKGMRHLMSHRQKHLLEMYLEDYHPELAVIHSSDRRGNAGADPGHRLSVWPPELTYDNGRFRFSAKPIWGIRYYNNENGKVRHTHGGAELHGYVGDNWSAWASLRDNYQTNEILAEPLYLTQLEGGAWKRGVQGRAGGDYSEMRAGIAYSWNWGSIAFQKDQLQWGDNYHGANILSGRTPSYPMIYLKLHPVDWLDFHYQHGWLNSMVVDSLRSVRFYEGHPLRRVHYNKFFAANMATFTPWPRLHLSVGNSVVYSEDNVYPGFLIPFAFFKSVVHSQAQNAGVNHNSAMFLNVSSRQIKHLHLYGSWFCDEFSKVRVGDPERTNFNSTKAGFRLSNWPLRDVALTAEYTFTYPKTFQHRTPTTTFESNRFNLGHYLRDNATELFLAIDIQPWRGLWVQLSFADARKGNIRPYLYGIGPQDRDPFMEETVWHNTSLNLKARYLLYNNISLFFEWLHQDVQGFEVDDRTAQYYLDRFGPELFHGKTNTLVFGLQMGF
jgi:hypothetical protein